MDIQDKTRGCLERQPLLFYSLQKLMTVTFRKLNISAHLPGIPSYRILRGLFSKLLSAKFTCILNIMPVCCSPLISIPELLPYSQGIRRISRWFIHTGRQYKSEKQSFQVLIDRKYRWQNSQNHAILYKRKR